MNCDKGPVSLGLLYNFLKVVCKNHVNPLAVTIRNTFWIIMVSYELMSVIIILSLPIFFWKGKGEIEGG